MKIQEWHTREVLERQRRVARNGKATPVQVCPRHTDVPACTHTYVHVRTYTHKYARTICILYAHTTGIDTWVKISPAIRRHHLMGRCGMGFSTAN